MNTVDFIRPTIAQKTAGNYTMDRIRMHGLVISVENRKGTVRSGTTKEGHEWSVVMPYHYGYIRRTLGADGDQVDAFVGPNRNSQFVVVVNQHARQTGLFEEIKVGLGYNNLAEAKAAYRLGYRGSHVPVATFKPTTIQKLKEWLKLKQTWAAFDMSAKIKRLTAFGVGMPRNQYRPNEEPPPLRKTSKWVTAAKIGIGTGVAGVGYAIAHANRPTKVPSKVIDPSVSRAGNWGAAATEPRFRVNTDPEGNPRGNRWLTDAEINKHAPLPPDSIFYNGSPGAEGKLAKVEKFPEQKKSKARRKSTKRSAPKPPPPGKPPASSSKRRPSNSPKPYRHIPGRKIILTSKGLRVVEFQPQNELYNNMWGASDRLLTGYRKAQRIAPWVKRGVQAVEDTSNLVQGKEVKQPFYKKAWFKGAAITAALATPFVAARKINAWHQQDRHSPNSIPAVHPKMGRVKERVLKYVRDKENAWVDEGLKLGKKRSRFLTNDAGPAFASKLKPILLQAVVRHLHNFNSGLSLRTTINVTKGLRAQNRWMRFRRPEGPHLAAGYIPRARSTSELKEARSTYNSPKMGSNMVVVPRDAGFTKEFKKTLPDKMKWVGHPTLASLHEHGHAADKLMPSLTKARDRVQATIKPGVDPVIADRAGLRVARVTVKAEKRANSRVLDQVIKHGTPDEVKTWKRVANSQMKEGYRKPLYDIVARDSNADTWAKKKAILRKAPFLRAKYTNLAAKIRLRNFDLTKSEKAKEKPKRQWVKPLLIGAGAGILGTVGVRRLRAYQKKNDAIKDVIEEMMAERQQRRLSSRLSGIRHFDTSAAERGWDLRDARGKSARVYAPGNRRRVRREKSWDEKMENVRTTRNIAVGAALLGVGGAAVFARRAHMNSAHMAGVKNAQRVAPAVVAPVAVVAPKIRTKSPTKKRPLVSKPVVVAPKKKKRPVPRNKLKLAPVLRPTGTEGVAVVKDPHETTPPFPAFVDYLKNKKKDLQRQLRMISFARRGQPMLTRLIDSTRRNVDAPGLPSLPGQEAVTYIAQLPRKKRSLALRVLGAGALVTGGTVAGALYRRPRTGALLGGLGAGALLRG